MPISLDYISNLTSKSVRRVAEFDKIRAIRMLTALIAVALIRGKYLLVRAVAEQAASRELSLFFAPEIAARIKGAAQEIRAGAGELREAAILNLDLRGFTALAGSLPPQEAMRLLAEYQQRMVQVLDRTSVV